jgi:hypothetical protein
MAFLRNRPLSEFPVTKDGRNPRERCALSIAGLGAVSREMPVALRFRSLAQQALANNL